MTTTKIFDALFANTDRDLFAKIAELDKKMAAVEAACAHLIGWRSDHVNPEA